MNISPGWFGYTIPLVVHALLGGKIADIHEAGAKQAERYKFQLG
jgi:hypothetical protein